MKDKQVKVWDIVVRLFHWSLVVAFIIAYISGEDEGAVHVYAGYIVIGLIAFRILWGYIGSTHARFKEFVYGPALRARNGKGLSAQLVSEKAQALSWP